MSVVAYWRYDANSAAWSNSGVAVLVAAYCIFGGTSEDSGEPTVVAWLVSVADTLLEVLFVGSDVSVSELAGTPLEPVPLKSSVSGLVDGCELDFELSHTDGLAVLGEFS